MFPTEHPNKYLSHCPCLASWCLVEIKLWIVSSFSRGFEVYHFRLCDHRAVSSTSLPPFFFNLCGSRWVRREDVTKLHNGCYNGFLREHCSYHIDFYYNPHLVVVFLFFHIPPVKNLPGCVFLSRYTLNTHCLLLCLQTQIDI